MISGKVRSSLTCVLALVLAAGCYRPGSSVSTGGDASEDTAADLAETAPDPGEDPPGDPGEDVEDVAAEIIADATGEDPEWDLPDLGEIPVTFAPDFSLEDLNPDSPTYGWMRSVSGTRGKVIVIYFGSFS